jgi:hypothetical protein
MIKKSLKRIKEEKQQDGSIFIQKELLYRKKIKQFDL